MAEEWQSGAWLLLDAAGPDTVYGILHEGEWADYMSTDEPFIAGCQPAVESLVQDAGLENLSGAIYGSGPGSTLGLRLAAMFIRGLMRLPGLGHWKCASYNNLELAAASLIGSESGSFPEAIAPWRRDRVHRARVLHADPLEVVIDSLHPEDLDPNQARLFPLGNRPRNLPDVKTVMEFPVDKIPGLLKACPGLLTWCEQPVPFTAESPDFARWSNKRHTAP